jgi:hypothetical protein
MTRLSLVLVASMISIPWTALESSAQSGFQNSEAFCFNNPSHPSCIAIMSEYCSKRPNDPVCMSDDDDDDDD